MNKAHNLPLTPIDTVIRALRTTTEADAIYSAADHADAAIMAARTCGQASECPSFHYAMDSRIERKFS